MRHGRLILLAVLLVAGACSAKPAANGSAMAAEVASYDLAVGTPGRFMVGLLTDDQRPIGFGHVALRFCFLGRSSAGACHEGPAVDASFLAIPGDVLPPVLPAGPSVVDAAAGRGVYAATAAFDRSGFWQVDVSAVVDGHAQRATAAFSVADHHAVPAVGDRALPTQNLTLASTGVPMAAIDSRATTGGIPDSELHRSTIAAALAQHRPIVVVFATPVFCVSRFCGPITDMVQQLADQYADRATFIHVEIWKDFQSQTVNQAAADWLLRNGDLEEPWVFVIGNDGRIALRLDNVATRAEIEPYLRSLPVIGPAPA
jgi:hypothetical protein